MFARLLRKKKKNRRARSSESPPYHTEHVKLCNPCFIFYLSGSPSFRGCVQVFAQIRRLPVHGVRVCPSGNLPQKVKSSYRLS